MVITKTRERITPKILLNVEKDLGYKLPKEYRDFLLKFNGGEPSPNKFYFNDHSNKASNSIVRYFHAVFDTEGYSYDNLMQIYKSLIKNEIILPHILPIASDPFGNYICIFMEGEYKGKIYFMDHEIGPVEPSYDSLSLIADTFKHFLNMLQ